MITSTESGDYSYSSVDLTLLEKHLKSGLWRLADQETRKVFYVACGMNPNEQAYVPEINKIPCDVLQAVDRLWVKYSRGRFGFSVQRPLWLECEKKYYNKTEAWNRFANRVGWRVDHLLKQNYWKKHNELTFELTKAPVGHFPHMGEKFSIKTLDALVKQLDWCSTAPSVD